MLGVTLAIIGKDALVSGVRALHVGWLCFGLCAASAQFALLGARWWLIARALGVPISYGTAVSEYYVSALLNQILPFGVIGDGLRALRHARGIEPLAAAAAPAPALRARVILALGLDRISGQIVLWAWVAISAPSWLRRAPLEPFAGSRPSAVWIGLSVAGALGLLWLVKRFRGHWASWRAELPRALAAFLSPRTLPVHTALSLVLLLGHAVVFYGAARSLGAAPPARTLFEVVPVVLAASSVPAFAAGFGIREASTGALYAFFGLRASDGALVAFLFGALGLIASLPGVFFLREKNPRAAS